MSFLAFPTQDSFGKVLRPVPPLMGKRPKLLPNDVFAKNLVVAVIRRGGTLWEFEVKKVTSQGGVLTVEYKALQIGGSAKFASPMVVAVAKGDYREVRFVENGKKAGIAKVEK